MEVSATEAVHTYCWISLRYFEYKSILEVSWQQEPLGVEVIPNSVIPNIYTEKLNQDDRFAYFQIIQWNNKIFCLETRPTQSGYGRNATRMEPRSSICISPVFSNWESVLQSSKGESQYSNIDNSGKANWTLLFNFFAISFFQPFLLSMSQSILKNSNGENYPFSPYPRYSSTWDVLAFIKNKWTDNKNFSNKHIIVKFTKLFALTSASRASFMHPLDIRFMFHSEESFFQFHKISKTMEKGQKTSNIWNFYI